jgi:hypothetical protein
MTYRKLQRLEKQKRRLWNGDGSTRFGVQYKKLINEHNMQNIEMVSLFRQQRMMMEAEMGMASTDLADG